MPFLGPAVRQLIVYKQTVILFCHLFGLLFQHLKIAAVFFIVNGIIEREKIWIFFFNIFHNVFFKSAPEIEIFQPYKVTLVSDFFENCFKISDTGKYRRNETDGSYSCIIYLLHCRQPTLYTDCMIHIRPKLFIQRIYRPGYGDLFHRFQKLQVPDNQIRFCTDKNLRATSFQLFQNPACVSEVFFLWVISIGNLANDYSLASVFPWIFDLRPALYIKKRAPGLSMASKTLHK